MKLSPEEYTEQGGNICPSCQSTSVEYHSLDFEGSEIHQEAHCQSCGFEWLDIYELAGYAE